jgi:putative drug exporter of the RND superfamily
MRSAPNQHAVSVTANPPAFQAMMRIGRVFHEFDSDSTAMVILKGSGEETD